MSESIRALIVVLAFAIPAFYLGARIAGSHIPHREFATWRNAWFAITVAAFLSGSFFVFAAIATIVCAYARSVRSASVGLFVVLLFAVPIINVTIYAFGIFNKLFEINIGRLLAILLLLPSMYAANGFARQSKASSAVPDRLVIGYVLLMIALGVQRTSFTDSVRLALVHTLDVLVPYFAFSRCVTSISDFRKVLLAFVIAVLPLSLIAPFESLKGWHLYGSISNDWGEPLGYIRRDGVLRAGASAGPIAFGFITMVAIGCLLGCWQRTTAWQRPAVAALVVLTAGLMATLSRGPWVGAAILVLVFLGTGPNSIVNLVKLAALVVPAVALLALTPAGARLVNLLPFIGSVDEQTVTYRERLIENAMVAIERNPWFGSSDYLSTPEMQQMIQGEGIIDTVNSYLGIALTSGLVGLAVFCSFFMAIVIRLWRLNQASARRDIEFSNCVRAAMATLLAILVTIGTVSSVEFIPYVYWSFAGLSVGLIRIAGRQPNPGERAANVHSLQRMKQVGQGGARSWSQLKFPLMLESQSDVLALELESRLPDLLRSRRLARSGLHPRRITPAWANPKQPHVSPGLSASGP